VEHTRFGWLFDCEIYMRAHFTSPVLTRVQPLLHRPACAASLLHILVYTVPVLAQQAGVLAHQFPRSTDTEIHNMPQAALGAGPSNSDDDVGDGIGRNQKLRFDGLGQVRRCCGMVLYG
jgi:hypothetical protein